MSNHESQSTTNSGYQLAIHQLLQLLEQGDEAQRCYSAQAVGKAGVTDAVPSLNTCLYHTDPDVVVDAAEALAKLAGGDIDALEDVALHHPESDARLAALEALSTHINGDEGARIKTILLNFANGRPEDDDWGLSSDWDDWWDIQLKAVQLLVKQPDDDVMALLFQLLEDEPEPELESTLYFGIAQVSPQWLVDRYQSARLMTRRKLIRAFAQSENRVATIQLFKALSDEDAEIRRLAVAALCKRQARDYQWDVVQRLCDSDQRVQQAVREGLSVIGALDKLSQDKLFSLAQQATGSALPMILDLIATHAEQPEHEHLQWIAGLLHHDEPEVVYAAAVFFASAKYDKEDLVEQAVQSCLNQVARGSLALHLRADFLRLLARFAFKDVGVTNTAGPVLHHIVNDEQNDVVLRQAAFDLLALAPSELEQQYLRELILGLAAKGEVIPVNQLSSDDEGQNDEIVESEELDLEQLLDAHEEKFSVTTDEDSPAAAPTSTLAAIQQTNVEAMLNSPKAEQQPEQHVLEMIEGLSSDYDDYSEIVRDHFDTSDKLELNRKKIAKRPQVKNKQLALRALGNSQQAAAIPLLIEALLGAEPVVQIEIFESLARLAANVKTPEIKNAIGAAANTLYHGDNLTKQAATRYLAKMPLSKALPLLMQGARDPHEHVRICSLMAIEQLLATHPVRQKDRAELNVVLAKALHDPAGGIRKLALKLLAATDLEPHLDVLLAGAIDNDEVNEVAAPYLHHCKNASLTSLAQQLPSLDDHRQPLAIKLVGELMSSA